MRPPPLRAIVERGDAVAEYRIGDFSLITRLSVKALRYYDEEGVLKPSRVDGATGYRYYDDAATDRARAVRALRDLDFSVEEIARMLSTAREDADIGAELSRKAAELRELARSYGKKAAEIDRALELAAANREAEGGPPSAILLRTAPAIRAAEIRYRGRYGDVGRPFGLLYRALGRRARGPAFCLYHELEYSDDAEISACMEIGGDLDPASLAEAGIAVIALPAEVGVETVHAGPYARLGAAYGRLLGYARDTRRRPGTPIREFYEVGPGLILRGNPERYRTRIFLPFG